MEIAFLDQFLISFMEIKNIIPKSGKFVWITLHTKRISSLTMLLRILMNISKEKNRMVNGEMILKFKQYLKYIQGLSKYMSLVKNQLEPSMNKMIKTSRQ